MLGNYKYINISKQYTTGYTIPFDVNKITTETVILYLLR